MSEDVSSEVIKKTQKTLGKYVKKPPLNEKLLKKPPFRFLHDVILCVIKETGFLKGLFSEGELLSDNVKEKDAKIAFLAKLIDAVKTITKTDLKVKPSKIVAGLEPAETNVLLQTIAKAIDRKLDSTDYVNKLKSGELITDKKPKKSTEIAAKKSRTSLKNEKNDKAKTTKGELGKKHSIETPKSTDRSKSKSRSKDASKDKNDINSKSKTRTHREKDLEKQRRTSTDGGIHKNEHEESKIIKPNNIIENVELNNVGFHQENRHIKENIDQINNDIMNSNENVESVENEKEIKTLIQDNYSPIEPKIEHSAEKTKEERVKSARPKSARPKSGEIKAKSALQELDEINDGLSNIHEANQKEQAPPQRPRSSLRPPSVRPSSARPGAPRLRPDSSIPIHEVIPMGKINVIVESFDKDADDEETVVIQNTPDMLESGNDMIDVPIENKGHLVEQILEQINDGDESVRGKVDIDWEKDGLRGKDAAVKDMKQLRTLIQTLTRTANPLGKLLNYLHEDVEAMQSELETWTSTKRQLFMEITKQKRISEEANKPLLSHLDSLQQDVKKVEQEILSVRSNILKNEIKIKELLIK